MLDPLYDVNAALLAGGTLALSLAALFIGLRAGRRGAAAIDTGSRETARAAQAALLGLMALLLGFTFALSMGNFSTRSEAVVEEANAIGTAWLRTDLVAEPARGAARDLMRAYLASRLAAGEIPVTRSAELAAAIAETNRISAQLWTVAAEASRTGGVVPLSFATAVTAMFDSYSSREAGVQRHVPPSVLLLLFVILIAEGFVVGFCSGIESARPTLPVFVMAAMTVLTVLMIIDLDRPRRGLIRVDQSAMTALAGQMGVEAP